MNEKPYRLGALGILFDDDDKVLLVQLASYNDNEWNFPGGGRENGETAEENAVRELTEELHVGPGNFEVLGVSRHPISYDFPQSMIETGRIGAREYRGQRKDQVFLRFVGDQSGITVGEHERAYQWVPITDLERYLVFPGQYAAAKAALDEFKASQHN